MKRKPTSLILATLASLLLASCSFSFRIAGNSTEECSVDVVRSGRLQNGDVFESLKVDKLNIRRESNEHAVFYVSLRDYNDLLAPYYEEDVTVKFSSSDNLWQVYKGSSYIFVAQLTETSLITGGSLYGAMKGNVSDLASSSLYHQAQSRSETLVEGENVSTYYYSPLTYYLPTTVGGTVYLPLGLLDTQFFGDTGIAHIYGYSLGLLQYKEYATLSSTSVSYSGKTTTLQLMLSAAIRSAGYSSMPVSLARYDYDCLKYTFCSRYGLASTMGISSMENYFSAYDLKNALTQADTSAKMKAYYSFFAGLNDGHTALRNIATWWSETNDGYFRGMYNESSNAIRASLRSAREAHRSEAGLAPYETEYSSSGDTAKVLLDGFVFAYDAFDDQGKIKKEMSEHDNDSYLYMVDKLNEAVEKGAKQVVLDISTNPGGVVYIMEKLLALLSKDNSCVMGSYDEKTGSRTNSYVRVDSNGDGVYDEKDCYGNKLSFYLLTSNFSFSCANCFPWLAKRFGMAKTIGKRTGGGECTVDSAVLPSGRTYAHSSMNHLGYVDPASKTYYGVERGVTPNIDLSYDHFTDVEAIESAINASLEN